MEQKTLVRTLFATIVAEVISFSVVVPIVPQLFTEPGSKFFILPPGMEVSTGYILLGVTIGLYPLGQFLATPILGELSDIYGRKRVIQVSVLGTVVSSLIFAFGIVAESFLILFLSRFVNGLTGGLISVAQATIADVTPEEKRSEGFGILGAAFGAGFTFGPFLGGLLSSSPFSVLGISTPFIFGAALSSLSVLFVSYRLEETSPMTGNSINWRKPFTQLRNGIAIPGIQDLLAANFLYFSGFAFFTTFIPVFLVERFGFSQVQTGNFFFYIGLLIILGQGYLVPKAFERLKEKRVMPVALFLTGFFILVQPFTPGLAAFIAAVTIFSLSNAFTTVSLNSLVSSASPDEKQGLALGTNQGLRALGNAFPSMLSGVAAAFFAASTPILISGTLLVLTAAGYKLLSS